MAFRPPGRRRQSLRPAGFDELGLRRALAGRMLPFLVAAMAILAALALAGGLGATTLAHQWRVGPATTLTAQIPRPTHPAEVGRGTRLDQALALLRATPGIVSARPISEDELNDLLRPWLGRDGERLALPLPAVVELRLAEHAAPPDDLARRLGDAVPGSLLESHGPWLHKLSILARSLQACALTALALVIGIAILVIGVATRAGLAARREAIEIVHGLGAADAYIAGRFAARISWLTMLGGIIGAVLALPMLAGLAWLAAPFTGSGFAVATDFDPRVVLSPSLWGLLPGLPAASWLIGWFTAQTTVRRWLRQLP
ncbi:MAG: cell division protein FtsX [Acetobacteraceae bacterium]|nr:cell division protein FtsX [Acetobacteraceae bacterium]